MAEYGNFSLSLPYQIDFLEEDIENIDPSIFDDPFEVEELSEAELSSILNEPTPVLLPDERQDDHRQKRFKCLKEEDLLNISEQRYSKSTKKNTQWGYNTFTVDILSEGTENADGRNPAEIPNLRSQNIVALLLHSSKKNEVDKVTIMAGHISSFGVQTLIPNHHDLFKNIYDTAEEHAKKATDFVVIWPKKLVSLYNAFLKVNDNGERQDVILQETSHGVLSCCILNYLLEGRRSEFRLHLFVEDTSQKKNSLTDFIESIGKQKHVFTYAKADRYDLQRFVLTLYGAGQTEPEVQTKIETFLSILAS